MAKHNRNLKKLCPQIEYNLQQAIGQKKLQRSASEKDAHTMSNRWPSQRSSNRGYSKCTRKK